MKRYVDSFLPSQENELAETIAHHINDKFGDYLLPEQSDQVQELADRILYAIVKQLRPDLVRGGENVLPERRH